MAISNTANFSASNLTSGAGLPLAGGFTQASPLGLAPNALGAVAASVAGLGTNPLATSVANSVPTSVASVVAGVGNSLGTLPASGDWRVRLAALDTSSPNSPYGPGSASDLCYPLRQTNGMLFPYTPTIQLGQEVDYRSFQLIHSNMDYETYARTPSPTITITGKFTCQNQSEAAYSLACVHFLRASSKMWFGEAAVAANMAGYPPPILQLSGYGQYMFNALNVVLKSHSFSYDEGMDTVPVLLGGTTVARLPALFSISVSLIVQQTAYKMRTQFDLVAFRQGSLMAQGGWI